MTTLTTLPAYSPPKRETQVLFALTGGAANFVRVWVTVAPPGSELRKKLETTTQNRFNVYEGDGGARSPWKNKFDVGGRYTLVAQEYTRGAAAYGGGYQGAPDGAPSETKVGSETMLSLYIGQRMISELGAGADKATLVLWVWDGTIQETSLAVHGEASPALQNATPTVRALAAMEDSSVAAALLALRNYSVALAVGSAGTVFADIVTKWNAHMTQSTVHQANDSDNGIPAGLGSSASAANLKDSISEVLPLIRQHYLNDAVKGGTVSGRDSGGYHDVSGKKNDNAHLPIIAGVGSNADAYWALADLWRSYEGHRVSTDVHDNADATNALTALPRLLEVANQFFTVLAATSPTVPPAQSSGAITLMSGAGFSETPL